MEGRGRLDEKRATESVCDARARPEAKKRQPQGPRRPSFRSRSRLPSRQLGWVGSGWLAKSHRFFYSIDRGLARVRLRQGTTPCTISAQPKETTPVWAHTSDRTPRRAGLITINRCCGCTLRPQGLPLPGPAGCVAAAAGARWRPEQARSPDRSPAGVSCLDSRPQSFYLQAVAVA